MRRSFRRAAEIQKPAVYKLNRRRRPRQTAARSLAPQLLLIPLQAHDANKKQTRASG